MTDLLSVHPADPDIDIVHDLQTGDVVHLSARIDQYAGKYHHLNRCEFYATPVTIDHVRDIGNGMSLLRLDQWWRAVDDRVVFCASDRLVLRTRQVIQ